MSKVLLDDNAKVCMLHLADPKVKASCLSSMISGNEFYVNRHTIVREWLTYRCHSSPGSVHLPRSVIYTRNNSVYALVIVCEYWHRAMVNHIPASSS